MLSQKVYQQELLKLDKIPIPEKINGVKIVDSVSFVNDEKIKDMLESNVLNWLFRNNKEGTLFVPSFVFYIHFY